MPRWLRNYFYACARHYYYAIAERDEDARDARTTLPQEIREVRRWRRRVMSRRRLVFRAARIIVVLGLLVLLATEAGTVWSWFKDKETREGITSLLTFAAALAAGLFALIRHLQTVDADRLRRITESYSRAVEHLSSKEIEQRLGGIYTLERIAKESPDDYWTVMETLTAFVRERAKWQEPTVPVAVPAPSELWQSGPQCDVARPTPATDIAAVLEVIRRRPWPSIAELKEFLQREVDREFSEIEAAVNERKRWLDWRFNLSATDLRGADLREAHLEGAYLRGAHLEGAWLPGAHLDGASLFEAHLDGVNLDGARVDGAILRGADFKDAHLAGVDLSTAYGDARTRLPEGIERPEDWPAYTPAAAEIVPPPPQPAGERDSKAPA